MRTNHKKITVIILLVSIILSLCFLIKNYDHDCNHSDNCPICALINQTKINLNGLNIGILKVTITIISFYIINKYSINKVITNNQNKTLFDLKVRLND